MRAPNKEESITKRILENFKERDFKMVQAIKQAIWDDKLKVYKMYRKEYDQRLHELEKDRGKIVRRKKNKKERQKALYKNTLDKMFIICSVIRMTFLHYKKQYFENDQYRQIKLMDIVTDVSAKRQKKLASMDE